MDTMRTIACRLCEGEAAHVFDGLVLGKYNVGYFQCGVCRCLQTESPYWLEESYSAGNLADTDTGSVMRNLNCQAVIYAAIRLLGFAANASIVDFGGGAGLLTRLLRDQGFEARWFDSFACNTMAQGFEDDGGRPDIVCSFEVAEHLVEPARELAVLFKRGARLVVIGTETFREQGPRWWYLSPHSGQHVFFYSVEGMAYLAKKFGYHYERIGSSHFFTARPIGRLQGGLHWRLLTPLGLRFVRAWLAFRLNTTCLLKDGDTIMFNRNEKPAIDP
jgi:Methyltransferase domain